MNKVACVGAWAAAAVWLVPGCSLFQGSPADKAANTERLQCEASDPPQADVQLIRAMHVLSVEPETALNMSSGGSRVIGTKIVLRPPEGITSDRLTRTLQCHAARAFLGHVDRTLIPHDPYFLPDAWVSIDVKVENGNYVTSLTTDTVPDNLRILHAASEFAAAQRAIPPVGAPQ